MKHQQKMASPNAVEIALGDALERTIQRWVKITGRRVREGDVSWRVWPAGEEF